ncbi:MAG: hypothetical protein ACYT04_96745, partial [Nostoc sp.]
MVQITKFRSWVGNQKLKFEFSTNVKTLFQPHFLNTYTCEVWGVGNGEWGMENGEWGVGNGEWRMENGEWRME